MAEVYAGFSEYTGVQVGRIIAHLEESGQLDNTLIFYCADDGASGEGSPNGSVNEGKFFNGWPDEKGGNLKHLDDLGNSNTCNYYPTGRAAAFSTPFRSSSATRTRSACVRSAGRPGSRHAVRCASSTTTTRTSCQPSSSAAV